MPLSLSSDASPIVGERRAPEGPNSSYLLQKIECAVPAGGRRSNSTLYIAMQHAEKFVSSAAIIYIGRTRCMKK